MPTAVRVQGILLNLLRNTYFTDITLQALNDVEKKRHLAGTIESGARCKNESKLF